MDSCLVASCNAEIHPSEFPYEGNTKRSTQFRGIQFLCGVDTTLSGISANFFFQLWAERIVRMDKIPHTAIAYRKTWSFEKVPNIKFCC